MKQLSAEFARRVLPGGSWEISEPLGSMGTTRVARRAGQALVAHMETWTDLLRRYLYDAPLAALVDVAPGRERLTIAKAADLFGTEAGDQWPEPCVRCFDRWREQAESLTSFPTLPTHADDGSFHAMLFERAVARRPWITS